MEQSDQSAFCLKDRTQAPPYLKPLIEPTRSPVNRGGMSFRTKLYSPKNQRFVKTESLLEMRIAKLFEFAHLVESFSEQPDPLRIVVNGKSRRYTPDFVVAWTGGNKWLVEVKPHEIASTPLMVAKFAAISKAAAASGYHFVVLTEKCLEKPSILLIDLLLSIRRRDAQRALGSDRSGIVAPAMPEVLSEVFELTHSISYRKARELVGAKAVLDLLANRVITWDLSSGLVDDTRLFRFEDGDDHPLFI